MAGRRESGRWGSNIQANWRRYVRDWHLRHQLAPADWSRYCLWQAVELVAGKLAWQRNRLQITASYSERLGIVRGSLGRYTSNYQVRELGNVLLQLATQHQCSRWLVNLRQVENINVPLLRWGGLAARARSFPAGGGRSPAHFAGRLAGQLAGGIRLGRFYLARTAK